MNTSELWITQEEMRLMLDGGLTWAEAAARAQNRIIQAEMHGIESKADKDRRGFDSVVNAGVSEIKEETFIPDYSEQSGAEAGLSGLAVLALVGGTGVLTLSLWLYLVIR